MNDYTRNATLWLTTPFDAGHQLGKRAHAPLLDAKVMLVDDDPMMTELVQAYLEEAGYQDFVVTNDPRETFGLLDAHKPDLLLLDLMMPEISGFEVLEWVRNEPTWRFLPVIVLTAATATEDKLRVLQLGATDFLSKPIDASELVLRVRNTLAYRQFHERRVNYDEVTGLPSRRLFDKHLREAVEHPDIPAVLYQISLPGCRQVGETLGPALADRMLQELARRVVDTADAYDDTASAALKTPGQHKPTVVARVRAEELGLLIYDLADAERMEQVARQLVVETGRNVELDGQPFAAEPAVGIVVVGSDGQTAEALLKAAEVARTQARGRAGTRYEFFSPVFNERATARVVLGAQLRLALARKELLVYYQPKVDMHTGDVAGVEALVRWQHPERGLLSPDHFIGLAEDMGLITDLGNLILRESLEMAARCRAAGVDIGTVAVNVSQHQFMGGQLAQQVDEALKATGLSAESLLLEITESMIMADPGQTLETLYDLRSRGIGIALDDFGTGYSSLSHIKKFPIGELKIDKSFIDDLSKDVADHAIVAAIVSLGHHLGMKVVAEGVETTEQLLLLHDLGCDMHQGYLFSPPIPEAELLTLLRKFKRA